MLTVHSLANNATHIMQSTFHDSVLVKQRSCHLVNHISVLWMTGFWRPQLMS